MMSNAAAGVNTGAEGEVRIMGSKSRLLQTPVANGGANAVPTQGLKWRKGWDSNPRGSGTPCRFSRPVP